MDEATMARVLEEIPARANVSSAFGEPRQIGEKTIIPVAEVRLGGGFGFGRPAMPRGQVRPEAQAGEAPTAAPGGGAGGWFMVRPVAVLEVTPAETRIRPVMDQAAIVRAAMLLVAWNVYWIARTLRAIFGRGR